MVESTQQPENQEVMDVNKDIKQIVIDLENGVPSDEIESLCMECKEQGITRFMYTKIPMFKEIILSSFHCEHCGTKNTEVQFGGKLAGQGVRYTYTVTDEQALNRSIVKSEYATIRIPELDFEIPPQTQKGSINTVEGFLARAADGLAELQEERRRYDPQIAAKLDEFIANLRQYQEGKVFPFTFELTDPAGNSFIQNVYAPKPDENLKELKYFRSAEEYQAMGYPVDQVSLMMEQDALAQEGIKALESESKINVKKAIKMSADEQTKLMAKMQAFAKRDKISANAMDFSKPVDQQDDLLNEEGPADPTKEAITFPSQCYACTKDGDVRMCIATIPFFKEIIIMCFSCEFCGYKTTEIKQGGGLSEHATKITYRCLGERDLYRDVFKSDTCYFSIPEIDLELAPGTLGSVYTTTEGMIDKIHEHLCNSNMLNMGDSKTNEKFVQFLAKLEHLKSGEVPFTFVMDDPLSNCFIYNPNAPADDPQIVVEVYDRTDEQNEELGLNDMNV